MENPFNPGGYWHRKFVDKEVFPSPETIGRLDSVLEKLNAELERAEGHGGRSAGQVLSNMSEEIRSLAKGIPSITNQIEEALQQVKPGEILNILNETRTYFTR